MRMWSRRVANPRPNQRPCVSIDSRPQIFVLKSQWLGMAKTSPQADKPAAICINYEFKRHPFNYIILKLQNDSHDARCRLPLRPHRLVCWFTSLLPDVVLPRCWFFNFVNFVSNPLRRNPLYMPLGPTHPLPQLTLNSADVEEILRRKPQCPAFLCAPLFGRESQLG